MDGFAIEVEEIEQEKHQSIAVAAVRCVLDQAERGGAVGTNAAQLAVEIGLPRRERCDGRRDRRVFMGPVEAGAGQQPDRAPVQPRMHPVAVEFEFVQPLRPVRWLVDQFGELRFHPGGQRRRLGAPSSGERSRHVFRHRAFATEDRAVHLFFGDALSGFSVDELAMDAGREELRVDLRVLS